MRAVPVIGVFALWAACNTANRAATPPAPASRCNDIVTAAVARAYAASHADNNKDSLEAIDAVKVRRCAADAWPDAMLDCVAHAAGIPELRACRGKLALDPAHALAEQEAQLEGDWEQYLVEAEGLRDKMCGCADRACARTMRQDAKAHGLFQPASKLAPPDDVGAQVKTIGEAFGACQRKLGGSPMDEAIAKMIEFKDEMCTCKDTACAQRVSDEMMKWGQDQVKNGDYDRDSRPSDDEEKRMAEITKEMVDCMSKAMSGGTP